MASCAKCGAACQGHLCRPCEIEEAAEKRNGDDNTPTGGAGDEA